MPTLATYADQPNFTEHPKVFGHQRLRQADLRDELIDGAFPAGEGVQDLPPPGLGHRIERVRCRRRSWHGRIIYPYRHMSRDSSVGHTAEKAVGCVLRSGAVAQVNHAVAETVEVHEFEPEPDTLRQGAFATPHHDGMEKELQLVDESCFEGQLG